MSGYSIDSQRGHLKDEHSLLYRCVWHKLSLLTSLHSALSYDSISDLFINLSGRCPINPTGVMMPHNILPISANAMMLCTAF